MIENLSEYLTAPLDIEEQCSILTPSAVACCKKIFSFFGRWTWYKKWCLKRLFAHLVKSKKLQPFDFCVAKGNEPVAFMEDKGKLVLSKGCFTKISSTQLMVIVFHELAHLWMKDQSFYPQLKAIDKQFRELYKSLPKVTVCSPIEFYADNFCLQIAKQFVAMAYKGKVSQKIQAQLQVEGQKLAQIVQTIRLLNG